MPPQEPRGYQADAEKKIFRCWVNGARSVLLVIPTGGGKTTCFADIVRSIVPAPAVILVHRRELAKQAANRLREFGVDFGFIMPGEPAKPYAHVQIATVQTLVRRKTVPPARLVVCDEAHLSTAATWAKIFARYPNAKILGCTATPWRLSGKPLAGAYDSCVVGAIPRELREEGWLCDYTGFSYKAPDLSNVSTVAGDYNEKQSAEAMREPSIVANIVEKWLAHASELSTVLFAVNVEHSKALAEEFRAAGVRAEHLDGKTPPHERAAILRRVEQGQTRVLCNVGVAVEGLDIPRLKCCIDANPTKSLARALQKWGRVRRPWQGVKARIHDHAFNIRTHGLPDDDRDYRLDAKPEEPPTISRCPACFASYTTRSCPECGTDAPALPTERREIVTVADAEAFEFDSSTPTTSVDALSPAGVPPVIVTWNEPGRTIEGKYVGMTVEPSQFGPRKVYRLQGKRRAYVFPGSAHLDALMAQAQISDLIRVKYVGQRLISANRWKKFFEFGVDDGS